MASFSPYANLILYNDTDDKLVRFLDFRTKIAGPNIDSNFMKIDTILDNQNTAIENIENSIGDFVEKTGSNDITGDITPLNDSSINLGSNNNKWLNIYSTNLYGTLNNTLTINGAQYNNENSVNINIDADNIGAIPLIGSNKINGNLTPLIDNNNNLGSPDKKWASLYCSNFNGNVVGNATTSTNATDHIAKKDNPHTVTKAQVGLGNVDNVKALPLTGGTLSGPLDVVGDFAAISAFPRTDNTGYLGGASKKWANVEAYRIFAQTGFETSSGYLRSNGFGVQAVFQNSNFQVLNLGGTGYAPCVASTFTPASSQRYKNNIEELTLEEAKKLLELRAVKYNRIVNDENNNKIDGELAYGFIAEEVKDIDDTYVFYLNEQPEALDYMEMIAPMKMLVLDLYNQIEELKIIVEQKG